MSTPTPSNCSRCQSPLEASDLRCAICGLPTPIPVTSENDVAAAVAQILRCHGCGAAVRYDATTQAPKCDFCGSVMEVEAPDDPVEQAERFVAFRVTPDEAVAALKAWFARQGFFAPSDLAHRAKLDGLKPLWWVGWLFDADVIVTWAADSEVGSRRSAWAPHSGRRALSLQNAVVPASRGLSEKEAVALVPHYRVSDATELPQEHADATVEQFAVQRSTARSLIARGLRIAAAAHARRDVPGNRVRNLHVAVLPTRLSSQRYAFPAYVLAYRYKDKAYRAVIHGQDANCVVGKAPFAIEKLILIIAVVLALVATVAIAFGIAAGS